MAASLCHLFMLTLSHAGMSDEDMEAIGKKTAASMREYERVLPTTEGGNSMPLAKEILRKVASGGVSLDERAVTRTQKLLAVGYFLTFMAAVMDRSPIDFLKLRATITALKGI
jgi:hypothetical protein